MTIDRSKIKQSPMTWITFHQGAQRMGPGPLYQFPAGSADEDPLLGVDPDYSIIPIVGWVRP